MSLPPPKQASGCIWLGLCVLAGFSLALHVTGNKGTHLLGKPRKCHRTGEHTEANVLRHSIHQLIPKPVPDSVTLFPAFSQLNARVEPPVHHPALHEVSQRAGTSQHGGAVAAAQHGKATPSDHTIRIQPWLGGRNFCTSEQARLSQGSAELGRAPGMLPADGKGMGCAPLGIPRE